MQVDTARGYVYARFWRIESYYGEPGQNPDKLFYRKLTHVLTFSNAEEIDLEYDFVQSTRHLIVSIGQTKSSLSERYANEKSPAPDKEWSALVNNPKKQEDELRASFKLFLSSNLYEIGIVQYRGLTWIEDDIRQAAKRRNKQIEKLSVFASSRQISTDMFDVPCVDVMNDGQSSYRDACFSLGLKQEILILTFFDTYFNALRACSATSIKQGTLI